MRSDVAIRRSHSVRLSRLAPHARHQWCQDLAIYLKQHGTLRQLLPVDAVAIQCTLFEKSPSSNWLVGLHRDLSVCVSEKVTATGWRGWSEKEGMIFVQPPRSVIAELVAVRIHLDACPVSAGALRVIPQSHRQVESDWRITQDRGEIYVPVQRGDAVLIRPLLLHASSKASVPSRRRVLHFLFAPMRLPTALDATVSWRWIV